MAGERHTGAAKRCALWIAGVFLVGGFAWTLLLQPPVAGEASRKCQCNNNLKSIGLWLLSHHHEAGCFPPSTVRHSESGNVHSWRTTLSSAFDGQFHEQYRFHERWDSEYNLALGRDPIDEYTCPSSVLGNAREASYLMMSASDEADAVICPHEKHVIVVEVARSGIHWTEPRDVSLDDISFKINDPDRVSISSNHKGGAHILWSDGTVDFLEDSLEPEEVRRILFAGREPNGAGSKEIRGRE